VSSTGFLDCERHRESDSITADDLESTAELVDRGAEAESGEGMVAKLARLLGLPEQDHLHRSGCADLSWWSWALGPFHYYEIDFGACPTEIFGSK